MSNDETINDALREAETAVSEIDIAGSGRISLDLLSLLFAQVGIPVEHQAPLRQDLLSTEEAQETLHLGYIEDSCFFAWFAALKKNELRAGAGGIHAARLAQSLQRIGLSIPLPLNPIEDVDPGAWNQQWQELLEAEASARTMENAVRCGMAVVDYKGKIHRREHTPSHDSCRPASFTIQGTPFYNNSLFRRRCRSSLHPQRASISSL